MSHAQFFVVRTFIIFVVFCATSGQEFWTLIGQKCKGALQFKRELLISSVLFWDKGSPRAVKVSLTVGRYLKTTREKRNCVRNDPLHDHSRTF